MSAFTRPNNSDRFRSFKHYKGNHVSSDGDTRILWVGGDYGPKSEIQFQNNRIVTSKYTLWNFFPKNLFEQFRRIANFYFLCMTIIALTIESPVEPLTSVLPLIFVIAVTALKQGYEDWLRHRSDNEVNCSLVTVIRKGIVQDIKAKDVRVGDLMRIVSDAEVPCDLVLLASSDRDGRCYITTANLDGETNLKMLVCPRLLRNLSEPEQLARLKAQIECEQPTPDLYNFYGKIELFPNEDVSSQRTSVQSIRTPQHAYVFGDIALQDANLQNHDDNLHHQNASETSLRTSVVNGDIFTNHNRNSDLHRPRNSYSEHESAGVDQAACRTSLNITQQGCDESEIIQQRFSAINAGRTRTSRDDFTMSDRTTIGAMPSARFIDTKDIVIQRNTIIGNVPFVEKNDKTSNSEFQRVSVRRSVITNQESDLESRFSAGHRDSLFENNNSSPLGTEHLLLRGARLKNTEFVIGCAVYTGQETKLALNSKLTSNKFSTVEKSINGFLIFFLCLLMIEVAISLALKYTVYSDDNTAVYLGEASGMNFSNVIQDLLSFVILYNYIIPISLYVTIETQKFIGSLFFKSDIELYCGKTNQPAICNTSDLNEELGQVEYLFTDKTGTLTENSMWFRRCSIAGIPYVEEEGKMWQLMADGDERNSILIETINPEMEQFLLALALCHSVQVGKGVGHVNNNTHDEPIAQLDYQASSPDEKALVEASARCGVVFLGEEGESMSVKVKERVYHYIKLNTLEFTSENTNTVKLLISQRLLVVRTDRKRMSVIVQDEDGQIWLYCKGAESAVIPLIEAGPTNVTLQHVADFAMRGLRTLVIGYKKLTVAEYNQLAAQIERSKQTLSSRRVSIIATSYEKMESNLILLGATGVEDQLQDGVQETLESMRAAGIKVWILTGDKVETAVNISFSCGHLKPGARQLYLTGHNSPETCLQTLKTHRAQVSRERQQHFGLIVDGQSLYFALNATDKHREAFSEICKACTAVICCRMSPLQKCQVVQLVKGFSEKPITAAIGDGANDVSMIQEAHVGLGIMGKEGRQAVRCSDFAFARFKFLRRVLLVHGHWYYLRIATLVQYFFYKNIVFITPQLYYGFSNCFSTETFKQKTIFMETILIMMPIPKKRTDLVQSIIWIEALPLQIVLFSLALILSSQPLGLEPLYNTMFLTFYNVLYTSLPIVIYGLFEQNHSAQTLLNYPQLYRNISQNILMSWSTFFQWITFGIWHSVVLYFIPWFIIQENQVFNTDNTPMERAAFGNFIYHCVIVVVNFKLVLRSRYWTWLFLGSILITVVGFMIITAVYSIIASDEMHYVYPIMLGSILFWLLSLLLVVTCLIPDCVFNVLQTYASSAYTKLQKKWKKVFGRKKRNHYSFNRSSSRKSSTMHTPSISLASKRPSEVSAVSSRRVSGGC